jgi:hypothetical protein
VLCAVVASGNVVRAACYAPNQQVAQPVIDKFLLDPAQILLDNPNGGAGLISSIRNLAASNPNTLPAIIALLSNANNEQKVAIGTALGQAAQACLRPDPTYAAQVQRQLGASTDQPAILAFAAVTGDRPIGGVGGGGGGGAGASGGGVGGQTSSLGGSNSGTAGLQNFSADRTSNMQTNYFGGGVTGGSSIGGTTIINNTITPVSPSQ